MSEIHDAAARFEAIQQTTKLFDRVLTKQEQELLSEIKACERWTATLLQRAGTVLEAHVAQADWLEDEEHEQLQHLRMSARQDLENGYVRLKAMLHEITSPWQGQL